MQFLDKTCYMHKGSFDTKFKNPITLTLITRLLLSLSQKPELSHIGLNFDGVGHDSNLKIEKRFVI